VLSIVSVTSLVGSALGVPLKAVRKNKQKFQCAYCDEKYQLAYVNTFNLLSIFTTLNVRGLKMCQCSDNEAELIYESSKKYEGTDHDL